MKVYVVTSGIYTEYAVSAVSLDKDEAERICAALNDERNSSFCQVGEYNTGDIKVDRKAELKRRFEITVRAEDDVVSYFNGGYLVLNDINVIEEALYLTGSMIHVIATLPKDTMLDQAKKIMLDRVAKFKAERAGIA